MSKASEILQRAFEADPNAMHALTVNRIPCNQAATMIPSHIDHTEDPRFIRDRQILEDCKPHVRRTLRHLARHCHSIEFDSATITLTFHIDQRSVSASYSRIVRWLVDEDIQSFAWWLHDRHNIRLEKQ